MHHDGAHAVHRPGMALTRTRGSLGGSHAIAPMRGIAPARGWRHGWHAGIPGIHRPCRKPSVNDRKKTPARRPRRTQEDRSAQMRARLLEAAIDSLYRHGYSATTTTAVCEAAGVSRGAMLHHFPTRIDLMLYVVRAVYEDEVAQYRKALADVPDRRERELMLPQLLWDVLGQPSGVAVLEIIQASRSDPELSARLRPVQIEIERDSFVQAGQMLGKTGVETNVARLMIWAVRGLSIARLLASRPEEVEGSIHLLREMLRLALDAGLVSSPDSEP